MAPFRVISVRRKKQFPKVSLFKTNKETKKVRNAVIRLVENRIMNPDPNAPGSARGEKHFPPHVNVERLGDVDLEAPRPGTVRRVHESDTQQLIIVIPGPVEDYVGAWQGGDVAFWIGCALGRMCLS